MIANIDDNVGRLRDRLNELKLADNTLLIFMTDNGTARGATFTDFRGNDGNLVSGFSAGMRGRKGSPYEGGHRVPGFWHWPAGKLTGGRDVHGLAAHFDVLPTLIDLCQLRDSHRVAYDGISLRTALAGVAPIPAERILVSHHQELPVPEKCRFASVMQDSWRLILRNDLAGEATPATELYRLADDPGQRANVAVQHPDIVNKLRLAYDKLWDEFASGFDRPAEIVVGSDRQNPVDLTCFEWHSSQQWGQNAVLRGFDGSGFWPLRVANAGSYEITLRRWPAEVDAAITEAIPGGRAIAADTARLRIGSIDEKQPVASAARAVTFTVNLPAGSTRLETWFSFGEDESRGAYYVTVKYAADRTAK